MLLKKNISIDERNIFKDISFDYNFQSLYSDCKNKKITTKYFREYLNLKPSSFYRRVSEFENLNNIS